MKLTFITLFLSTTGMFASVNGSIHNQLLLNNLQVISQKYGRNL